MPARLEGESLAALTMPLKFEAWAAESASSQHIEHTTPAAEEGRRGRKYYRPAPGARMNVRWRLVKELHSRTLREQAEAGHQSQGITSTTHDVPISSRIR